MRVWLTGGTGFVGSNIVHAAEQAGHSVMTTIHSFIPDDATYLVDRVDMLDPGAVHESVDRFRPDVVVHCAILNDWDRMYADRQFAWDAYVTATRTTSAAAANVDAAYVVVSTDFVFDGTQSGADEDTPPNPVNLYGVLKLASEMVALERGGAVARVSGVNGVHRARPNTPRHQDPGFGYFVASLVDNLRAGKQYTVWESDSINMVATPSLATECGEIILEIGKRRLGGVFHCSGADAVSRRELAEMACDVFELDAGLLRYSEPPPSAMPPAGLVPYDSSLTTPRTDELLERAATPARTLLSRFRQEYEE